MSIRPRRGVRTTAAAAAGIAAISAGVAGQAMAAPGLPTVPGADALGSAPALGDPQEQLAQLPVDPSEGAVIPGVFVFEIPTVTTDMTTPADGVATPATGTPAPQGGTAQGQTAPGQTAPGAQTQPARAGSPQVGSPQGGSGAAPSAVPGLGGLGLPALPLAGPELADRPVADLGGTGLDQVSGPDVAPESLVGDNSVGALPSMDTAALFTDLVQRAAAGEDLTGGNAIG